MHLSINYPSIHRPSHPSIHSSIHPPIHSIIHPSTHQSSLTCLSFAGSWGLEYIPACNGWQSGFTWALPHFMGCILWRCHLKAAHNIVTGPDSWASLECGWETSPSFERILRVSFPRSNLYYYAMYYTTDIYIYFVFKDTGWRSGGTAGCPIYKP